MLKRFIKDDSGQGLVEYSLAIGMVALTMISSLSVIGKSINREFSSISDFLR
jgi:Flp pilus assembly pilin Flp